MKFLQMFWRYWKWLCVALGTTFILLFVLAAILNHFKQVHINDDRPVKCLDAGGTWDAEEQQCRMAS